MSAAEWLKERGWNEGRAWHMTNSRPGPTSPTTKAAPRVFWGSGVQERLACSSFCIRRHSAGAGDHRGRVRELGFTPHAISGAGRTAIGITGNKGPIDPGHFRELPASRTAFPSPRRTSWYPGR